MIFINTAFRSSLLIGLFLGALLPVNAHALLTELGINYGYQKKTFSANNLYQTESKSATLSFYFWEKFALETNYTTSFYESKENDTGGTPRTVQQSTEIMGADLVFVLAGRSSMFQPYIKAGSGFIKKKKQVRYENSNTIDIPTKDGWAPSYGAGLKVKITERFSVKLGYDVWKTPLDDGTSSDDTSFKAGLSFYL